MQISALTIQVRDKNRVNVMVDGKFRFSLEIGQVGELGIKVGKEYTDAELTELETESTFGKLYARALEYSMMRPHSTAELRQYLYKKTRDTLQKNGEIRKGIAPSVTDRVYDRLVSRGYVNDENFARYWIENRQLRKGISRRKLMMELRGKGIDSAVVESLLGETERSDQEELQKVIAKKAARYDDRQKLIAYLMRQGFRYDDILSALESD
ncbi:MAG: regulatory protein RecX [Candidatus Saccharibacteria bacterium]|nr:regulatory protein RecX [Candidatus Saccharibacteria bacterium]